MVIISKSIIIVNDKSNNANDKIDIINIVFIVVNKIEITAANKDSTVDVTIDTNVSLTTLSFLGLSFTLFSTITAANPNNMVNTREKTVVNVSANSTLIWYDKPKVIKADIIIGKTIKRIKSQIENFEQHPIC